MLAPLALIPALALLAPGSLVPPESLNPCRAVVHVTRTWDTVWQWDDRDDPLRPIHATTRVEFRTTGGRLVGFDTARSRIVDAEGRDGWTTRLHCLPSPHLGGPTAFVVLDRSPAGVLLAGPLRWEDLDGNVYELMLADWGPDGMTGWLFRWPAGRMGDQQ
jgi:hypothetical protein